MAVDPLTFRKVAGRFATGVTVVTTVVGSEHHGMTANSFTTVSLDPPLVLVSVDRQARFHSAVLAAGCYGVSVLSADRHETARWFATQARPRDELQFGAFPHRLGGKTGVVLLDDALATFECVTHSTHEAGDHTLVVGEVLDLGHADEDAAPLLYFRGRYHDGWH